MKRQFCCKWRKRDNKTYDRLLRHLLLLGMAEILVLSERIVVLVSGLG
jgi:hypothetical protein